jgi:hypothetical protein
MARCALAAVALLALLCLVPATAQTVDEMNVTMESGNTTVADNSTANSTGES